MRSASGVRRPASEYVVPCASAGLTDSPVPPPDTRKEVTSSSERRPLSSPSTGDRACTPLPNAGRRAPDAVLILASASPRRRDILTGLGIPFEVIPSGVDETDPDLQGRPPLEIACTLARRKAEWVADRAAPDRLVLGADTVVVIEGQTLGKPRDEDEARRMLRWLSGQWHEVITGVALVRRHPAVSWVGAQRSQVHIRPLAVSEIDDYIASGEPMDKAGAYAAQGIGRHLIRAIRGSYSNVVGLPRHLEGPIRLVDLLTGLLGPDGRQQTA